MANSTAGNPVTRARMDASLARIPLLIAELIDAADQLAGEITNLGNDGLTSLDPPYSADPANDEVYAIGLLKDYLAAYVAGLRDGAAVSAMDPSLLKHARTFNPLGT